jgi:hypothetical protein
MPTPCFRRTFLKHAALLPVVVASGAAAARAAFAPPRRVGGSHLRPALNAYSFLVLLNANAKDKTKGIDLFGVCDSAVA